MRMIRLVFAGSLLCLPLLLSACVAEDGGDAAGLVTSDLQASTTDSATITKAGGPLVVPGKHVTTDPVELAGSEPGACGTCIMVMERIKKGTNMLLPSICAEIYATDSKLDTGAQKDCGAVIDAVATQYGKGGWLFEGCYKYEAYQAKGWVKPCPSHVMCSVLKNQNNEPFCKP